MSTQVTPFDGMKLPTSLMSQDVLNLAKNITGGLSTSTNRMSIKGARFRLNVAGQERVLTELSTDMVIVNAIPHVSRVFYGEKFNEDNPGVKPTCRSRDGVRPDADIPAADKQSAACAGCPKNVKGSADDNKSRACAFKKRLVVMSPNGLKPGALPVLYALDANATTIFGEDNPQQGKYSLQSFFKVLSQPRQGAPAGIPPQFIVTRFEFDPRSSTPKLLLSLSPGGDGYGPFLNEEQQKKVIELARSDEVTRMLNEELVQNDATADAVKSAAPAPAIAPPKTWQEIGREVGMDDDAIEMIEAAGGPYTEKGAARWTKFGGPALPAQGDGDAIAANAPAPTPPPPPPPPPKKHWKVLAKELEMDDDDIEMIEVAGGPGTEAGLKRWVKLGGTDIGDDIDTSTGEAAAPAPAKGKGGRPRKDATATPAPAPTPPATPPPVSAAPPAVTSTAGAAAAKALAGFDDE